MTVPLAPYATKDRIRYARSVGRARLALAREKGRTQPFGNPGDDARVYVDENSCIAEALVADWLGLPWNDALVDNLSQKPPDVGDDIEVRWTKYVGNGHLLAHETDNSKWYLVLVWGELPDMEVKGWTVGSSAKQQRFRRNPKARSRDDYWVPPGELLMGELLVQMKRGKG